METENRIQQLKGGNERMENKNTSNLEEEIQKNLNLAAGALNKGDCDSADRFAIAVIDLKGNDSADLVYRTLASRVHGGYETEQILHNLASRFACGFGGYCSGASGGGMPNRTNRRFAEALDKQAEVYSNQREAQDRFYESFRSR